MRATPSGPGAAGTLFETGRPVRDWLREWKARGLEPPVALATLDAYLLRQVTCLDPGLAAVVDLAAPATWGATTLLLAHQAQGKQVIVPALPEAGEADWPAALKQRLAEVAGTTVSYTQEAAADVVRCCATTGGRVLVTLAANPGAPQQVLAALHAVGDACRRAVFVLLPLRELAPCLSASTLALVHARECDEVCEVLERVGLLFAGNFDFLSLAEQGVAAAQEAVALRDLLQSAREELILLRQQPPVVQVVGLRSALRARMARLLLRVRQRLGPIKRFLLRRPG
jgi:hypothetical protein